ncbi:hypothetical protein M0R04_11645 [Candidatus Dojkabacteria bacterium]|jgi:hypothetical protein|nr:hypothetical protein [Candidatus Dojkabacteria bacterium]
MKVLIACEYSGTVRDAFSKLGHEAISCDILPSETIGNHYQGDIRDILYDRWDLIIAHPPCTYICNSGVCWLHKDQSRWLKLREATAFFNLFTTLNCPKVCIENPIPHKYAMEDIKFKYTQLIQPWQFGHGETKATCLWLKGLPKLIPSNIVEGREQRLHMLPPSPDRAKLRSKTYQGIADAMANQWGLL